jgi:hypothetical protein
LTTSPRCSRWSSSPVAPVFLLTAIGTVIAALNIRLGRAVDRRRDLEDRLCKMPKKSSPPRAKELAVVRAADPLRLLRDHGRGDLGAVRVPAHRGRLHRHLRPGRLSYTIGAMFVLAMLALIASLLFFYARFSWRCPTPRHVPR